MSRFVPWANGPNLEVVLKERYIYLPECAPTTELLDNYKKGRITWNQYEQIFKEIITSRNVEKLFSQKSLENACFLCAEENPTKCHRRLIAEYIAIRFANIEINHL
jgi:uncharacterized protein YeaO (DUF488 family)